MTRVVISFPARNEVDSLNQVLDALGNQTLMPVKVVIANDGSSDNTKGIALSYDFVEVHDREKREGTVVGKKEMANVWNSCIIPVKKIHEEEKVDYIVFLGADIILPPTYIQDLVTKFEENPKLMIAAGKMEGDFAYQSTGFMIPGPGRMMRYDYWLSLGGKYKEMNGWEAYPVYKANFDGYSSKVFASIPYFPMRATGGRTDYFAYGQAMRALGYSTLFALGRILKQPFLPARTIVSSWHMFRGFFFGRTEKYEPELRKYVRSTQRKRLRKIFLRF